MRALAQRTLERAHRARTQPMSPEALAADAVVVAPHPDDETLGCGGTVLRKLAAGAEVAFVFLTDGAASHRDRVSAVELALVREQEAREAASVLGVASDAVHFIGAPDSRLAQHADEVLPQLVALLERHRPAQVFAPFQRDGLPDHVAAATIAGHAARAVGVPELFGFPVWFWNHWPWMRPVPGMLAPPRRRIRNSLVGARALLSELRVHVDVAAELPTKREALARHRSQMKRRDDDPDWLTLADVAEGDFLARLLRDREVFAQTRLA